MEKILARLESLLDRLADPAQLDAEAVDSVNQEWMAAMQWFGAFSAEDLAEAGEQIPGLRERIAAIRDRLPQVEAVLLHHKDEISAQLVSGNRRMQSLRMGYGQDQPDCSLLRQQV